MGKVRPNAFTATFGTALKIVSHLKQRRIGTFLALVLLGGGIGIGIAQAQTNPSVTAPISIEDAMRRGQEAVDRENYTGALDWYRKAAEQGSAVAQDYVGMFYLNGWGVKKNYTEAMAWFQKSAAQGYAAAQSRIGLLYHEGWGVPQDDAQAFVWLRKAAEQGDAAAENFVGLMYAKGLGVPKDYGRAMNWFRKPADRGDPEGQTHVGMMYHDGLGVPRDYAQALVWYRKAAAQGYEVAKARIAEIEKHLNAQAAANRDKIPAALQYRCWLETSPPTNNRADDERRFQVCLHSNWKRLFGNTPFPGD